MSRISSTRSAPIRQPGRGELVALLAMLMAMLAFSTDSLLPAMTEIGESLSPDNKSHTQLLISGFLFGTGIGMLVFGPLSDTIGRRATLAIGAGLFSLAAAVGAFAPSLEVLIALRVLQGIGAAASRTVAQAVMRDLFSGADQARIASLVFMAFVAVPALAPLIGQQIIALTGWRGVFFAYVLFALGGLAWFLMRQPETLKPEHRRPFRIGAILGAFRIVFGDRIAMRYVFVQVFMYAQFITYLSAAEQLWVDAIGVGDAFPIYFAICAVFSATAGFINSRLVIAWGMRRMLILAFGSQIVFAGGAFLLWTIGPMMTAPHWAQILVFGIWSTSLFFINGLTLGNITALAMEPLGHVAGTASAVIGAAGIGGAVFIAVPLGLAFDGTPRPIMAGATVCSIIAFALVRGDMRRARA